MGMMWKSERGGWRKHVVAGVLVSTAWMPAAWADASVAALHSFSQFVDGALPMGIIRGADGNFYGTTFVGGPGNDFGTVFRITPEGGHTLLHYFVGSDGSALDAGVIQARDGDFYGTTSGGGAQDMGTVFRITPDGVLTSLYSFSGSDGREPHARVIQGSDGNFYGTTDRGGANDLGTVFKLTPDGTQTLLHSFAGPDGQTPYAELVQDSDGSFYGTTFAGGSNKLGTVFRISPDGTFTSLHSFALIDGVGPQSGLVKGADGAFYGTAFGGSTGNGVVYRITTAGAVTALHTFTGGAAGCSPVAGLLLSRDGNFYGTTTDCGTSDDYGVIYRLSQAGAYTVLAPFTGPEGKRSLATLAEDATGHLYGVGYTGGDADDGTVFKLDAAPDTATPPAPVGVTATAGDLQVSLNWTASAGASAYDVYQGQASGAEVLIASGITGTSFTATGLVDGTTYYFFVAATNGAGVGPNSSEVSATPVATGTAEAPQFSVPAGSYASAQTVAISDATPGAAIYYSIDGSAPSTVSTRYTGPITITSTTTLKAVAVASGYKTSAVATAVYSITGAADGGGGPSSGGGASGPALLLPLLLIAGLRRRVPRVGAVFRG